MPPKKQVKPITPNPAVENRVEIKGNRIARQTINFGPQKGHDLTDLQLFTAFGAYLRGVATHCSKLVTRGIDLGGDGRQNALRLAQVYVSLDTTSRVPGREGKGKILSEGRTRSALEVLLEEAINRVVLVGDPGSGKSTFFQFVTLCLATPHAGLKGKAAPIESGDIPMQLRRLNLVPLQISLREFSAGLKPNQTASSAEIFQYLRAKLERGNHSGAANGLSELLKRGLALVLFDGLDEVPSSVLPRVREAIESFTEGEFQSCRVAVTCRKESYRKSGFRLNCFPDPHEIAPLSRALQLQFIRAWYEELEILRPEFKGEGTACVTSLADGIRNERLQDMAGNPFF